MGKKVEGECRVVEVGIDEVWKRARERVQSKMMFPFPRVLWVLGGKVGGNDHLLYSVLGVLIFPSVKTYIFGPHEPFHRAAISIRLTTTA